MKVQAETTSALDDLLCYGVAKDIFHANFARRWLEELDTHVPSVNAIGIGKNFVFHLQILLERHLCLTLCRIYERFSPKYPTRSIRATLEFMNAHAAELKIQNRKPILGLSKELQASHEDLNALDDTRLTMRLVKYFQEALPIVDDTSTRDLDLALAMLKSARDKGIAHHEAVEPTSLMIPDWRQRVAMINEAEKFFSVIAESYLNVHRDFDEDAAVSTSSLRNLLKRAGV